MNVLQTFYNNIHEREAVKTFLVETLKGMAVERTFAGEDVSGIKEANNLVERAFEKLEESFGDTPKPIITNSR